VLFSLDFGAWRDDVSASGTDIDAGAEDRILAGDAIADRDAFRQPVENVYAVAPCHRADGLRHILDRAQQLDTVVAALCNIDVQNEKTVRDDRDVGVRGYRSTTFQ